MLISSQATRTGFCVQIVLEMVSIKCLNEDVRECIMVLNSN